MTTTTKASPAMRLLRAFCFSFAFGVIAASAQTSSSPSTAPPSPADMLRQASTLQGTAAQGFSSQSSAIPVEGGSVPISAGDLIEVQVFATPELSGSSRVNNNGDITLPICGNVHVAGLDPAQAAIAVQDKLKSAQLMIDPHVRVFAVQYAAQGITVLGEVARPGGYPLPSDRTLWGVIAGAAGLTTNAGKTITIAHRGDPEHPQTVPLNSLGYSALLDTTPVAAGDSIVVSRAENYYIVGDAGKTGEFPIINDRPNTVLNALALTGGATRTAKLSKASIIRTTPAGVQTIPVNLKLVLQNKAPNVTLQAYDILVIPRNGTAAYLDTLIPTISLTVMSAVISALVLR